MKMKLINNNTNKMDRLVSNDISRDYTSHAWTAGTVT
jgi:hypothetical protein